jgi:hypothetical protein
MTGSEVKVPRILNIGIRLQIAVNFLFLWLPFMEKEPL